MKQTVKISIIVPVHNNEAHLRVCLDTILSQTMREIEVICIDDASIDSSGEILEEYEKADDRVTAIVYDRNRSASQARKDGCLRSQGEYVLFVDGDDYLLPRACEELYEEMQREPVDILQFGTYILNYSYMPQMRIKGMEDFVQPLQERLKGEEIFTEAFRTQRYGFNLWNKIYNAAVCKRAMAQIEDGNFPKAQDKYAFFAIALEAESYRGIAKKYYVYRFGSGITGHEAMDLDMFRKYCAMGKTAAAMERLLEKKGLLEKYEDIIEVNRSQLLKDIAANWIRLKKEERESGLRIMEQFWSEQEVQYVRRKEME